MIRTILGTRTLDLNSNPYQFLDVVAVEAILLGHSDESSLSQIGGNRPPAARSECDASSAQRPGFPQGSLGQCGRGVCNSE